MIGAGVIDFIIGAGGIAAALVAIAALIEKVFAPVGKMLGKWITDPVVGRLDSIESYVRHHLGPNGTTTPVYRRLERLEEAHNIHDDDEAG